MSSTSVPERARNVVERLLARQGSVASREVAGAAAVSRQTAHAWLSGLVDDGELVVVGRGRGTRYRRPTFSYPLEGLDELAVWRDLQDQVPAIRGLGNAATTILEYGVTEMVNNAIDHSGGTTVQVTFRSVSPETEGDPEPPGPLPVEVDVVDDGIGIFDHLMIELGLADRFDALQQLSKGKVTTDPVRHTGEGIFFTSKAVDRFQIASGGILWLVDNLREDVAVGSSSTQTGTAVSLAIDPEPARTLGEVFDRYTEEYEFSRTRTVIRLFEIGTRFVSRSEAKRLVRGLEEFRDVVLDFRGVELVGQGFVDEVFRVWAREHPETRLEPVHMNPSVEFMVRRGLPD